MVRTRVDERPAATRLSDRQAAVLRAVVRAYVGEAAPIGSETLSHLLPVHLSPASVRNSLAELTELGLIEKPHRSAGRVPTERGLRVFVDALMAQPGLAPYEKRSIASSVKRAGGERLERVASQLLSERTRQLGFVVAPRLDRVVLRHVSLVRLSAERVLAVLVSETGNAYRRVIEGGGETGGLDQGDLERLAALVNERVAGRTLDEVRRGLESEARGLRRRADRLAARAVALGRRLTEAWSAAGAEVVIESRRALLEQPEFRDPDRLRELFAAIETRERLLEILERVADTDPGGVQVAFGEEVAEPGLWRCALVATRYGTDEAPLGMLGVIGPSRMDYGRVIPLVEYLSQVMTERLSG